MSKPSRTDFVANMRKGWGDNPPEWVAALAAECDRIGATEVGKRLGYTVAVISGVVLANYKGSYSKVEALVKGVYLGATVECPVLGEIERDRCEREQAFKHFGTSALRTRIYNACRSGCPNSRLKKEADHVGAP